MYTLVRNMEAVVNQNILRMIGVSKTRGHIFKLKIRNMPEESDITRFKIHLDRHIKSQGIVRYGSNADKWN